MMMLTEVNYCPYCGKKINELKISQLNYCCFCGTNLKKVRSLQRGVQCTICHDFINPKKDKQIKCSFCGSQYHSNCITSWLLEYNSCPMCLNVFLMPKI